MHLQSITHKMQRTLRNHTQPFCARSQSIACVRAPLIKTRNAFKAVQFPTLKRTLDSETFRMYYTHILCLLSYTHTHIHILHLLSYTHIHILHLLSYTHIHTISMLAIIHTVCIQTHIYKHTHIQTHTYKHTHTNTHIQTHTQNAHSQISSRHTIYTHFKR